MGTAIKHPVPEQLLSRRFLIFDIQAQCPDFKNYNDGLTRSVTGRSIAVPIWQQQASKG